MSTATEESRPEAIDHDFATQLAEETVAIKLRKTHLSRSKSLTPEQKRLQATTFHASPDMLSGSKKLFRRNNEALKAITRVMGAATEYFRSATVEYPEEQVRLLRRDRIDELEARMNQFVDDLADAVSAAEEVYQTEILPEAEERLGDLHDRDDYPQSLLGQWSLDWEYVSVQPDERLARLNPQVYEQAKQRVQAKFEEALHLQEQAFIAELQEFVASLAERLSPQEVVVYRYSGPTVPELEQELVRIDQQIDVHREIVEDQEGSTEPDDVSSAQQALQELEEEKETIRHKQKLAWAESIELRGDKWTAEREEGKKVKKETWQATAGPEYCERYDLEFVRRKQELKTFKASTVTHLTDFFERFKQLNIGSNEQLDRLVDEAKATVSGVDAGQLKQADQQGRDALRMPLEQVASRLEELLVDKPKRRITLDD